MTHDTKTFVHVHYLNHNQEEPVSEYCKRRSPTHTRTTVITTLHLEKQRRGGRSQINKKESK